MEIANLKRELDCSVCLNIYTDPVMLICGHNFCRVCIDRFLDTQVICRVYSCPECRERFTERPVLHRNIALRKIAEHFLSADPDQEENSLHPLSAHFPAAAVISCLLCEVFVDNARLAVQKTLSEQVLSDPGTSLGDGKLSFNKELSKDDCTEDGACGCLCCKKEHLGQHVKIPDDVSDMKKKLKNILQKFVEVTDETEKKVQGLQERQRKVLEASDGLSKKVTALLRDIRRRLKDLEGRVLMEISRNTEGISLSYNGMIQDLVMKKDELSRKMRHIEELCNMEDPLTVLQESDTGDLCDTEVGDNVDTSRCDKQVHKGGDIDVAGISLMLHTQFSDVMSGIHIQTCSDTQTCSHICTQRKLYSSHGLVRPHPQPSPKIQHTQHQGGRSDVGPAQESSGLPVYADILLDVSTAGNRMHISQNNKTATWVSKSQNRPATPERFLCPQVLSSNSFSSGRHYWEVDVQGSQNWRVGMCYPNIDRRGEEMVIGNNNKSWCLERDDNHYSARHDRKMIKLPNNLLVDGIRVYVDYEAGLISFYALCDPIRHLHTFTAAFLAPLHAALWAGYGGGCIKLSGGNRIM
ncbi:E3 ubiquitin/ISG15 ligase TRIM25-like [Hyperolius riggenbachi]|uniref:E3 ubiquitin/ISG15 ligase TRIM25-like n=1 Tax=Hyperolius riggenbachi TaxID=752182 RepID=UPI0035A3D336